MNEGTAGRVYVLIWEADSEQAHRRRSPKGAAQVLCHGRASALGFDTEICLDGRFPEQTENELI